MPWLEKTRKFLVIGAIIYNCMVDFIVEITQRYKVQGKFACSKNGGFVQVVWFGPLRSDLFGDHDYRSEM